MAENEQELQMMQKVQEFQMQEIMTSCPAKFVIGSVGGFGLGGLFGLFMSSADNAMDDKFLKMSAKEQAKITLKQIGQKAWSSAKTFGVLSAVFVSSECITETIRGKDDHYNSLISGCATGAILARHAGIQAMGAGCVGFSLFQMAIETYMHSTRHDDSIFS